MKQTHDDLLEILESVYFDTLTPLAERLQAAGVDLLESDWDPNRESYWEPVDAYSDMTHQR